MKPMTLTQPRNALQNSLVTLIPCKSFQEARSMINELGRADILAFVCPDLSLPRRRRSQSGSLQIQVSTKAYETAKASRIRP